MLTHFIVQKSIIGKGLEEKDHFVNYIILRGYPELKLFNPIEIYFEI